MVIEILCGDKLKIRSWRGRLLLLLTSLLVALLLAEAGLHLSGSLQPLGRSYPGEFANRESHTFIADQQCGWVMRPDVVFEWETEGRAISYRANTEGCRITEDVAQKDAPADHSSSIALLGDSFIWGFGLPWQDSLAGKLQQMLPATQLTNFAQPGYGLDQMCVALETRVIPTAPQLIVVGIFPDDLERSFHAFRKSEGFNKPRFILDAGVMRPFMSADTPGATWRFLERHSLLLAMGQRLQRRLGRDYGVGGWWRLNAAVVDRMSDLAATAKIPILFVHVPHRNWEAFPALQQHLDQRQASYIDLQALPAAEPGVLYFPQDGHMNAAGHAFMAQAILRWLAEAQPQIR